MTEHHRWSTLLIGLLAVTLGFYGCANEDGSEQNRDSEKRPAVPVEIASVQLQDLKEVIDSIGSLEPWQAVEIRPEITAIIHSIHFQEGQSVNQGDLLFTLDDSKLRQRLDARQAALAGTQVEMHNARRAYERRQELYEKKVIASETRDEARTEFKAAQSRVERLTAEIRVLKEQLRDTRIRSPISGHSGELHVDRGDFVKAGDLLVSVLQIDRLKVTFTIPERFMLRVQTDQVIKLETNMQPDKTFSGRVYFLSPQIQQDTRHLLVKAMVDNAGGELRPGAFVSVKLIVGQHPAALVLPEEALIPTRSGYGVFVVRDARAVWRPVSIGLRKPGLVEIRRGLKAGEVVIRVGHISVSDGDRVRVDAPS